MACSYVAVILTAHAYSSTVYPPLTDQHPASRSGLRCSVSHLTAGAPLLLLVAPSMVGEGSADANPSSCTASLILLFLGHLLLEAGQSMSSVSGVSTSGGALLRLLHHRRMPPPPYHAQTTSFGFHSESMELTHLRDPLVRGPWPGLHSHQQVDENQVCGQSTPFRRIPVMERGPFVALPSRHNAQDGKCSCAASCGEQCIRGEVPRERKREKV